MAAYRDAVRLQPTEVAAHNKLLGVALDRQEKLTEAIAAFREAIRLQPDFADAHNNLGLALDRQRKPTEAIAEFREAIRLDPAGASAYYNLGRALGQQGRFGEAMAEYRAAIRHQPDFAMAPINRRNAVDAIAAYREVIRLQPDDATAYQGLAWALVVSPEGPLTDSYEAVGYARKAVELAPTNATAFRTLALAEYRHGQWARSRTAIERCTALQNGRSAIDWFILALVQWQRGDKDQARIWFDEAVGSMNENAPKDLDLRQLWREAAELLGRPGPAASAIDSPAARVIQTVERRQLVSVPFFPSEKMN